MIGVIEEIIVGHDNKIRIVKVKQNNSEINFHTIKNLYLMKLNITHGNSLPPKIMFITK